MKKRRKKRRMRTRKRRIQGEEDGKVDNWDEVWARDFAVRGLRRRKVLMRRSEKSDAVTVSCSRCLAVSCTWSSCASWEELCSARRALYACRI